MTPAQEAQVQAAWLDWFRAYMAQPDFMVGPDAVKAAFLAGVKWRGGDLAQIADAMWAKLTEDNPACSCCNGDDEYVARVNEIGAMIDGRRWVRRPYKPDTPTTYETVPGGVNA